MDLLRTPMQNLLGPMDVASFLLLWFVVSILAGVVTACVRDLLGL